MSEDRLPPDDEVVTARLADIAPAAPEAWPAIEKPWQVTIDFDRDADHLSLRVRFHTHGSVAFSMEAAEQCGGATEEDDDGYTTRCRYEPAIVHAAREIAAMSEADVAVGP